MPNISDYVRHNNTVILGEAVATSIFNVLSTKKSKVEMKGIEPLC